MRLKTVGTTAIGWVGEAGHAGVSLHSPYEWVDFKLIESKPTTAAYGSYFADFKQMEEFQRGRLGLKDADLDVPLREVRALLDANHDGQLTLAEVKAAQRDRDTIYQLSRVILRYPSEWKADKKAWDAYDALIPPSSKMVWESEKARVTQLVWWDAVVGKVKDFPVDSFVFHIHPVGLLINFLDGSISIEEARVRAFLRTVRFSEGTEGVAGYERLFGGKSFIKDFGRTFSDHPRILIKDSGYSSTAAGAYQVMGYTWDDSPSIRWRERFYVSDFSPVSQDRYCVVILKMKRKALDFIKSGELSKAVFQANCKLEWASFPGAPYDQGGVSWEDLNEKFTTLVREELAGKSDLAVSRGALDDLID